MVPTGEDLRIVSVDVKDIRFPTSLGAHGSDAMHTDPDYSCVYVTLTTERGVSGNGLTFTLGRGTDVVKLSVLSMKHLLEGRNAGEIFGDFSALWRSLTSESQLRWIGPEKGVTHLAVASLVNALWDLWAKLEGVPLWRLLTTMDPKLLVSTIDFRYITDVLTPEEAVEMLENAQEGKEERIAELQQRGYPAYTTQVGWMGYSDGKIRDLCRKYLDMGFRAFKIKVGKDISSDIKRCELVRSEIGYENTFMIDANQIWDVQEAIDWVKRLSQYKPMFIEEPTSPDDVLGHAAISRALRPFGIGVATGEMCCNRVLFKQFLQAGGMQYCQIDSARIGGVNEILSVYLMAKKFNIPVIPHAGGVGLCEMVQHLQMWEFTSLTKSMKMIEYVDQQHDQFVNPAFVVNANYLAPREPGYSTELTQEAIENFEYPVGKEWQKMFSEGIFQEVKY
ncbi:mitochondrial enolase superfamily member 1-like [Phlebotomus argentipes]|uniref:mitochondrial enolase superfamily member 1-like n=1 Tax=Phlebotomus argentipes TaxID=94469 RepID=UPI0028932C9B|nr:mitochondrial enolase superfamily member 1-like [Phlebotomus argentipes]